MTSACPAWQPDMQQQSPTPHIVPLQAYSTGVCVSNRINPTDEEGKSRTAEKMTELVQEAHQAHTKKALNGLKVPPLAPLNCIIFLTSNAANWHADRRHSTPGPNLLALTFCILHGVWTASALGIDDEASEIHGSGLTAGAMVQDARDTLCTLCLHLHLTLSDTALTVHALSILFRMHSHFCLKSQQHQHMQRALIRATVTL